ncbi:MAG: hypothetical protein MI757_03405 [Pirellulales bacterium]|nr:hypothetical protein [Pirellulales bacterium]
MSNRKIYRIKLTEEERSTFGEVAKGKRGKLNIAAWKVQRAKAMLLCDESESGRLGRISRLRSRRGHHAVAGELAQAIRRARSALAARA